MNAAGRLMVEFERQVCKALVKPVNLRYFFRLAISSPGVSTKQLISPQKLLLAC